MRDEHHNQRFVIVRSARAGALSTVIEADGAAALREIANNGCFTEDITNSSVNDLEPPQPGIWIWEGTITYTFDEMNNDGDWFFDGDFRRLTVQEIWRLRQGQPIFSTGVPPGIAFEGA